MMDLHSRRGALGWMMLAAVLAVLPAGCGAKPVPTEAETKKFLPVDESSPTASTISGATAASATADEPPARLAARNTSAAADDPIPPVAGKGAPPSAEMQAVLEQLDRLARQQPKGNNEREMIEDFVRTHTQRLALAKQALKLNPDRELRRRVVMAMYEVYQRFVEFSVPSAMSQLGDFAKTMAADADPEVARIGRHAQFTTSLARIRSQPLESGQEIVAEAKKLLDAERGNLSEATLDLVGEVADMLTRSGLTKDSVGLIETIADVLAADPKLAERASQYKLTAKLIGADFNELLTAVAKGDEAADEKAKAALQKLLSDAPPSRELLRAVQDVPYRLEFFGHYKVAEDCYDVVTAAFDKAGDSALAAEAKDTAQKAKQRMSLIGQPLTVEGVNVDGSPFDWSAYAGKIVLVDFWATWCGPCLAELPNIRQNFEQFHAKGFEVVGLNLDTTASDLKQFLTLQGQAIPWATVTSQVVLDGKVTDGDWSQIPMAAKCGVTSIPFVVLIGKDGKVDSIHVRGPKLGSRLKELLGDPITTEVPADPTQPGAARPTTGKQSRLISPFGAVLSAAIFISQTLFAAEPPENVPAEDTSNPYLAKPGLTSTQLVAFIQKMLDRPQAIQSRPGFAEAIVDACDRIGAAEPAASSSDQLLAVQTKLAILHREACDGKDSADKQLMQFVEQLKDDQRPEVAREVAFFRLERRVLDGKEAPLEEVPTLLKEVREDLAKEKLTAKHLRLASSTVAVINRLESGDERETQFAAFGKIFSASSDKGLAQYGKKLGKKAVN